MYGPTRYRSATDQTAAPAEAVWSPVIASLVLPTRALSSGAHPESWLEPTLGLGLLAVVPAESSILELAGRTGPARPRRCRRLDNPAFPSLVIVVAAGVFVIVRVAVAAHGNLSELVVAGRTYVDPARSGGPAPLPGNGYDGQFYYRLALNPSHLSVLGHGIRLDTSYRVQRIGYPSVVSVAV